ncbi:MAG: amidohydrolase family protein [Pseudomonadales bacterium]|nr:amidohydrolase family protein [Pseudomonadales bacterium]MCP5183041.1 amidohydrolase family protein [Pseudomonadales bacterium]
MGFQFPVISADSHITEHPDTYSAFIEARWKDKAPRLVNAGERGDVFVIDGMDRPIAMGLVAAAGKKPEEITEAGVTFAELHRGGWDPVARLADQDRDGVSAEIIYPTVGMLLCNHPDFAYKDACFAAYNRWIAGYCAQAPARLLGCGQTAATDPASTVADLHAIKALGLRGVMMAGNPGQEDYDSEIWNPVWEAAIELDLPLSFHILTMRGGGTPRGPRLNTFLSIIRGNQDIMGMLIFGGVFERYPALKICCVEADAGWVPHYLYRMDHAFKRHRNWLGKGVSLSKLPSEYFLEHIYITFQDDWVAFKQASDMNWRRLMWANDFPHSDSTWPWSQDMLAEQTRHLTSEQTRAILCDNVAGLYHIDIAALPRAA